MAKSDIDYAVGDIEVEDGRGGFVPVRQLTDRIRREKFDSPEEVIRALEASRDNLKSQAA